MIVDALIITELFDYSDDELVKISWFYDDCIQHSFFSHIELIYTCISKFVIYISRPHSELLDVNLKSYADPNDYNRMFYRQRNSSIEEKPEKLLKDSDSHLARCGTSFENAAQY